MKFTSILAIYALFWTLALFFVLPFRLRSGSQPEEHVPGQVESAPPRFSFARTCLWTSIVAACMCGLYYANYVNGWIGPEAVDFFHPPVR